MSRKIAVVFFVLFGLSVVGNLMQYTKSVSTASIVRAGSVKVSLMDRAAIGLDLFKLQDRGFEILNTGMATEHLLACGVVEPDTNGEKGSMRIPVEQLGEGSVTVVMQPTRLPDVPRY